MIDEKPKEEQNNQNEEEPFPEVELSLNYLKRLQ